MTPLVQDGHNVGRPPNRGLSRYLDPRLFRLNEVRQQLPALCELLHRHNVRTAYLFGSVLQDAATPLSDLDIAVLPPSDLDEWLEYHSELHRDLCQLFQADNIDLGLLDQAPLSLQAHVVLVGERILDVPGASDWEEQVLARYAELAGWREENWEMTRQWVRQGISKEANMIDRERVERFVFLIRDAIRELQNLNLASMGLEQYQAEKHVRALSEHYLRIALEATLDLGRHVIVRTGLGVPQEYRDVGKILREQGVVADPLGRKLETMAGMRNVLVHLYWDVDPTVLHRVIVEELDSFERIMAHIFHYLENLEVDQ